MADVQSSLASLQEYKDLRANATNITRPQWSNIDVFQDPSTGEVIQLCHLVTIAPFVVSSGFEYTAGVSLAAHHLNSGDGTIIHEVEGLNESCPIRFTLESFDSFYDPGQALQAFEASVTRRDPQGPDSKACAIIGPSISSAAGPVSVAGGVLDIPSISGSTTSPDLEDKSLYPLFARTIPSDEGTSVSLALFFRDVMKANHLAMIHLNNAYGNGFKEALNTAILTYAPDMRLLSIPFSADPSAIARIVSSVKASGYRHIFCLIYSPEENDALMTEAYKQGIAGDGRHNWFFGDAFTGVLNGRVFEVGSPLFQAYFGSGLIQVSGGLPGMEKYDVLADQLKAMRTPSNDQIMAGIWPKSSSQEVLLLVLKMFSYIMFLNRARNTFQKCLQDRTAKLNII